MHLTRSHTNKSVVGILLTTVLTTTTGCFGLKEKLISNPVQAQPASLPQGWKTHRVAGIAIASPMAFTSANQRLDNMMGELSQDVRLKIQSYEGWDAKRQTEDWIIAVNRITYVNDDIQMDLDGAAKGTITDLTAGVGEDCKPEYTITPWSVDGLPGRRLSARCYLANEGNVKLEALLFSQEQTLWIVKIAFSQPSKRSDSIKILDSIKLDAINTVSLQP